jgi:hypothetical protein
MANQYRRVLLLFSKETRDELIELHGENRHYHGLLLLAGCEVYF